MPEIVEAALVVRLGSSLIAACEEALKDAMQAGNEAKAERTYANMAGVGWLIQGMTQALATRAGVCYDEMVRRLVPDCAGFEEEVRAAMLTVLRRSQETTGPSIVAEVEGRPS